MSETTYMYGPVRASVVNDGFAIEYGCEAEVGIGADQIEIERFTGLLIAPIDYKLSSHGLETLEDVRIC